MVLVSDKELLPEHSGGGAAWEGGGDDVVFWLVLLRPENTHQLRVVIVAELIFGKFRHSKS